MPQHISIIGILKQSGKFNLVGIVSNVLSIPKSIIIAMVLAPKDYGIISFLGLWSLYAGLFNPGLLSARSREMANLIGSNNDKEVLRIQNISHTSDFIYSLLPFFVILCAGFFVSDRMIKIGFILTAFSYISGHLVIYWRGVNFVRQRFNLVAKADLIHSVSTITIAIIFIFWLKAYAVLLAPVAGAFFAGMYYSKRGAIGYKILFNWKETLRLSQIGISFSMLALAYWGFQLIDKTIVAAFFPLGDLGIYSYAVVYIFLAMTFLRDFGNVLAPVLWTKAGQGKSGLDAFYSTKRIVIYLAIITAIMIPLSQVCFYFLTQLLTKKFIASMPIFIVLSCNLYLAVLAIIPSLILQSSFVNKQVLSLKAYVVGLILNIALDIFAIRLGCGIFTIAVVNVVMQGLVTFLHFYFIRNYITSTTREFNVFILYSTVPFLTSIAFCFLHYYLLRSLSNAWLFGVISLPAQIIAWLAIIRVFYREYFPKYKIVKLAIDFRDFIYQTICNMFKRLSLAK